MSTELNTQIKDIAQNVTSLKTGYDELLTKLADDGDLIKAPEQIQELEKQFDDLAKDIDAKIAKVHRTSYNDNGQYRGHFDNEDQARAFGALFVSRMVGKNIPGAEAFAKRCGEIVEKDYPDIHKRAMDSVSDGSLLMPEFSSRLIRLVEQFGVYEAEAFAMPMGGESLTFMRRTGGMTVYVVGEGSAPTQSDPSYGNVTLVPKELATLTYIPLTLEEDALPAIGELVAQEIAQAFAEAGDDDGFNGDGSSTYHGFTGVIPKLIDINGVDDGGGLTLGSGNAWSELTQADHDKLMGGLPTYVSNPKYYCSRPYFAQVLVKLMHSAGGVTAGEIEGRRQLMFNGDPVRIVQKMAKTEANSQIPLLYGDLRLSSTVGQRRQLSVDADRSYKFAERQVTVLGYRRIAINNHDLGTADAAGPVTGLITAAS